MAKNQWNAENGRMRSLKFLIAGTKIGSWRFEARHEWTIQFLASHEMFHAGLYLAANR